MGSNVRRVLALLIAAVLVVAVAVVVTDDDAADRTTEPVAATAEPASGSFTGVRAEGASIRLELPLEIAKGTGQLRDGDAIVLWDGSKPLRVEGEGALDVAATSVSVDLEQVAVLLDGIYVLPDGRELDVVATAVLPFDGLTLRGSGPVTIVGDERIERSGPYVLELEDDGTFRYAAS